MTQLHETLMGRKLIEGVMPDIAHQLERIAVVLENKDSVKINLINLIKQFPNDQELGAEIRKTYGRSN